MAELVRAAPLSPGKVAFAWRTAVGPAFERVTSVRLEARVLFVEAVSTHWAREVARSSPIILPRIQALLGEDSVGSITVRTVPNPEPRTPNP